MNTASFFTLTIGQQPGPKGTGQQALGGTPFETLPPGMEGLAFFDQILTRIMEANAEKAAEGETKEASLPLTSDNPMLEETPELDIAELVADSPEIAEEVEQHSIDEETDLAETLALNQQAFDEILKPFETTTITIENIAGAHGENAYAKIGLLKAMLVGTEKDAPAFDNHIKAVIEKVEALIEEGSPVLIALNITPEQIADLKAQIESEAAFEAEIAVEATKTMAPEAPETTPAAALFAVIVSLLPPQARNDATPASQHTAAPHSAAGQPAPASDVAAALNNMTVGANADAQTMNTAPTPTEGFEETLQKFTGEADPKPAQTEKPAAADNAPAPKPDLSALQNLGFNLEGTIFAGMNALNGLAERLGFGAEGFQVNSLSQFTNLLTQTQTASQAHPAMQTVAATIQKAAGNGEAKNLIIQLDPPELGRVEVRMEFGDDKSLKTVLTAEKPETYLMLQRDAHLLERALQDIGLDGDSALSFELAQDGHEFSHDGGHDSGGQSSGSQQGGESPEEIIEATMTWQVDPETGHTHYNILA